MSGDTPRNNMLTDVKQDLGTTITQNSATAPLLSQYELSKPGSDWGSIIQSPSGTGQTETRIAIQNG